MTPRKPITAHVLLAHDLRGFIAPGGAADEADAAIARNLDAKTLETKPFVPLPVLGVPGWCADNTAASFYADAQVFRPLPKTPTP